MSNPWTKKNPFLSLWLSGANQVMNRARGQATAAVKREANKAASAATAVAVQQVTDFWTGAIAKAPAAPAAPRKRRKTR